MGKNLLDRPFRNQLTTSSTQTGTSSDSTSNRNEIVEVRGEAEVGNAGREVGIGALISEQMGRVVERERERKGEVGKRVVEGAEVRKKKKKKKVGGDEIDDIFG